MGSYNPVVVAYKVNGVTVCGEVLQHHEHRYVYASMYRLPEGKNGQPFSSVPFAGVDAASNWLEIQVKRHDGGYYDLTDWKDQVDWCMEHEGWRDEVYEPLPELTNDTDPFEDDAEEIEIPADLHGGHTGFWLNVDGEGVHVLGDPSMSEETANALRELVRAARKHVEKGDTE